MIERKGREMELVYKNFFIRYIKLEYFIFVNYF